MTDSHSRASAGGAEAPRRPAVLTNRWVALAIVFVTRTTMGYQFQAIASVGPLIVTDLGLSWAQLGSLIGLYMLPGAFLALPGGMLGQRLGERRTVVASLALMIVGGIITAAAHGYAAALAGRVLAGVGAVLMSVLLAKMVADWFVGGGMSTAMAIMLTSCSVPLGGLLTDRVGRPNLIIVAGSVVAAIVMTLLPVIDHSLLAFCLVGLAIGGPPGGLMALLPKTVAPARLATSFGIYYTVFYIMMAAIQSLAGVVRDVSGSAAAPVAFAWARAGGRVLRVLGGGSNLLVADEGVDGLVVKIALRGTETREVAGAVELTAAAGEPWDDLVCRSVERGWAGLECLSGIPG